ncbi:MAG: cation diffusion facilitator family transporter [Methylococcaceae bacterium]|nr:cation diffusion facilitator family transporter [Methylococcaceae bacterium]
MSATGSKSAIWAALIGNSLVAITKFIAAALTGSSAMFSEGIHSLVDTGNQVLLLYGLKRASKPADENFPFGYGKEVYFWSFIVAILVFAVGAGVSFYEGIHTIFHPKPIANPMINYVVLILAIIFEGASFTIAFKQFVKVKGNWGYFEAIQQSKDPSLFVVLFEDFAATIGLFVALLGVYLSQSTGILEFDGIASVIIGCILAGTAVWLAIETKGLLIGEGANQATNNKIKKTAISNSKIQHVNEVLTMHMGPDYILLNLSVTFVDSAKADDIEKVIEQLSKKIKAQFPSVKRIFIEAEAKHSIITRLGK